MKYIKLAFIFVVAVFLVSCDDRVKVDSENDYNNQILKEPIITLGNLEFTQSTIVFKINLIDIDHSVEHVSVEVYEGNQILNVVTIENFEESYEIEDLDADTTYKVTIKTIFDLQDDYGKRTIDSEYILHTMENKAPSISVNSISETESQIVANIELEDENGVVRSSKIKLYNSSELVEEKVLTIGDNEIVFYNLLSGNDYSVLVEVAYDLEDGDGETSIEVENKVKTTNIPAPNVEIDYLSVDFDSLYFSVNVIDESNSVVDSSIYLLHDNAIVEEYSLEDGINNMTMLELLSDTIYTVRIEYTYDINDSDGVQTKILDNSYKTMKKTSPKINVANLNSTDNSVSLYVNIDDISSSFIGGVVFLYKDMNLEKIHNLSSGGNSVVFNDLDEGTAYTVELEYKYDLNKSKGIVEIKSNYTISTITSEVESSNTIHNTDLFDVESKDEYISTEFVNGNVVIKYLIGSANQVPLSNVGSAQLNTGGSGTISINSSKITEVAVSTSVSDTIEHSYSISGELPYVEVEVGYEYTTSSTETFEEYVSEAEELGNENTLDLSGEDIGYWYSAFMFGNYDIIQVYTINPHTGEVTTEFAITNLYVIGYGLIASLDGDFTYELNYDVLMKDTNGFIDVFEVGDGSLDSPFEITNANQLMSIYASKDSNFKIMNSISLESYNTPNSITFSGSLDGGGNTLSNYYVNKVGTELNDNKYEGIFPIVSGSISNLIIDNSSIYYSSNHSGSGYVIAGILVGELESGGIISEITIQNSVVEVHRSKSFIGGLVGSSYGNIIGIVVSHTTVKGNGDLGGILGHGENTSLTNCIFTASSDNPSVIDFYSTSESRSSGGIAGYLRDSVVIDVEVSQMKIIISGERTLRPRQGFIIGRKINTSVTEIHFDKNNNETQDVIGDWVNERWPRDDIKYDDYYFADGDGLYGRED